MHAHLSGEYLLEYFFGEYSHVNIFLHGGYAHANIRQVDIRM